MVKTLVRAVIFGALLFMGAGGALACPEIPAGVRVQPPEVGAHAAAIRAFKSGNFKPLEVFLCQKLAWHEQQVREYSVDLEAIRDTIIKNSVEKKVHLNPRELEQKIDEAMKLIHGPGGGTLTEDRRQAWAAAESLSYLSSLKFEGAKQKEYRQLAMKYE